MRPLFTHSEAWVGGFYELAMELPGLEPALRREALSVLWTAPTLRGCYLDSGVEPEQQTPVPPGPLFDTHDRFFGVASLPNGCEVACLSWSHALKDEAWLALAIPMGSLGRAYPVGAYPFPDGRSLQWRESLHAWLRSIAAFVYRVSPFRLGLVGWEANDGGLTSRAVLASGVPPERYEGLIVPTSTGLQWHPPTMGAPFAWG